MRIVRLCDIDGAAAGLRYVRLLLAQLEKPIEKKERFLRQLRDNSALKEACSYVLEARRVLNDEPLPGKKIKKAYLDLRQDYVDLSAALMLHLCRRIQAPKEWY